MEATATEAHIISYGLQRALDGEQLGIRTFQRWVELGVLERIWAMLIEECEELGGVDWEWQSADCAMSKARFGGIQSAATPRIGARWAASGTSWLTGTAGR